jgi:hypothetical protein
MKLKVGLYDGSHKTKTNPTNLKPNNMKAEDKKQDATPITRVYANQLREIHPKLPAYFCGRNGAIVPIASGEEAEQKMAELELVRLEPEGHIDTDVLWAIYELMAEAHDDFWPSYHPQVALIILRKALHNKNSKLNLALSKAYGDEK